jgi:4'-phosphopantetheinyl transferase
MPSGSLEWLLPPLQPVPLDFDEVHTWRVSLDPPGALLRQLECTLSPDEHERASRFHFQEDRDRFIAARGSLRMILSGYVGLEPGEIRFRYSPYGKPGLEGLQFNLSHAHLLGLVAVARGRAVGVDIEYHRPALAVEQIARRFFSTGEADALLSLPDEQQPQAFLSCWTRKEAYIKARGEGLSIPLDQFDVSLAPDEPAALLSSRLDPQEAARWTLYHLVPGPGYVGALAIEGRPTRLLKWQCMFPLGG